MFGEIKMFINMARDLFVLIANIFIYLCYCYTYYIYYNVHSIDYACTTVKN